MLAEMGLHAVIENQGAARARALVTSVALTLVASGVLLSSLGARIYATPENPFAPWWQVALFAVVAALLALIHKAPRRLIWLDARRIGAALLLVLVADLFGVSRDMELNQTVLASDLATPPPVVARLQSVSEAVAPARFWSNNAATPLEPWQRDMTVAPDELDAFRARQGLAMRSLMPSCVASAYGAPGLTGAWGALMPLRRHPHPIYEVRAPLALKLRWLRLLGARHHLSFGAPLQHDWSVVSSEAPAIYRDDAALPRAFWLGEAVWARPTTALARVGQTDFDPRRQVVLETDAEMLPIALAPSKAPPLVAATWARYDETQLSMSVEAPAPGYLVLMDSVYPGWHARVDGRETPIVPANYVGRAVAVDGGAHRIEMRFEPQSVRLGTFVSLVTLGVLASVCGANWRRNSHV